MTICHLEIKQRTNCLRRTGVRRAGASPPSEPSPRTRILHPSMAIRRFTGIQCANSQLYIRFENISLRRLLIKRRFASAVCWTIFVKVSQMKPIQHRSNDQKQREERGGTQFTFSGRLLSLVHFLYQKVQNSRRNRQSTFRHDTSVAERRVRTGKQLISPKFLHQPGKLVCTRAACRES